MQKLNFFCFSSNLKKMKLKGWLIFFIGMLLGAVVYAIYLKYSLKNIEQKTTNLQPHKLATLSSTKRYSLSDGESVQWQGNKECYINWNEKINLVSEPLKNAIKRELIQEGKLVAVVFFPIETTDAEINPLLDQEAFLKLKNICSK